MEKLPDGIYRLDLPEGRYRRVFPGEEELGPGSRAAGALKLLAGVVLPSQLLRDLKSGSWGPYVDVVGVVDWTELRNKGEEAGTRGVALLLRPEGFSLLASRDRDPYEFRTGTKYLKVGAGLLSDRSGNYTRAKDFAGTVHGSYRNLLEDAFGARGPVCVDVYLPQEERDCIFAYERHGAEPLELESRRGQGYGHPIANWLQELRSGR